MTGKGHGQVPSLSFPSSPLPAMDFLLRPQVRGALDPPVPTLGSSLCSLASATSCRLPPAANSGESGARCLGNGLELPRWAGAGRGGGDQAPRPLYLVSSIPATPCCSCPHLGVSPGPAFFLVLLPLLWPLAPPRRGLHTPPLEIPMPLRSRSSRANIWRCLELRLAGVVGAGQRLWLGSRLLS